MFFVVFFFYFCADEQKGDCDAILKKSTEDNLLRRVSISHYSVMLQVVMVHNI